MDDNFFPMEFTIRPNVQETFEFPGRTTFRVIFTWVIGLIGLGRGLEMATFKTVGI